ncbi:alpha/beta-type small acid-soluble spore protein [Oceanobacillus piezotolerans]|uniref:Alpha/beta-type small acid-soluble spore protein n=1 Tax=Oceanobacillus piezotolerans TaxID=2448030 RepID=A0A498DED0_9BACI|nr:alpha/beta-type small acid-soluble spore protein [Oceanobacillus piezotolerans]RLL41739.1 alpha/beta-type small acid-soluble spore protein [Oceanobacillus piezotolerans]
MARNKILVPEAREGLNQLKAKVSNAASPEQAKYEVAKEQGISLEKGYNGNIRAKDAGKVGGTIGGRMVKSLIEQAKTELNKKH